VPGAGAPRWGWHELGSRDAARLVRIGGVVTGDLVLDIGAGTGAITAALRLCGARVVAVELHPERVAQLRSRFAGDRCVTVVRADAADLRLPGRPFKVVANPPFGITTALVRRLTGRRSSLTSAVLVLPPYAVARWSGTGDPAFAFSRGGLVPARAFRPPPPSDARVLVIERRAVGRASGP